MTRVLLVEDDAWLAELQLSVLQKAGYEVTLAPHALAAIELVDSASPDIIVLDVLLAGSTAFALLNELQSYTDTGAVPIILCTNLADQLDPGKLREYGVNKVVDKTTMHPDDVIVAIRSILL